MRYRALMEAKQILKKVYVKGVHSSWWLQTQYICQSVPLATSPKPLSSKYSFGLVNII